MGKAVKMDWDPKYSVDIEEIDNHQKKMFDLFNQLIDLKDGKKDAKECISMISEINDYSKLYFSDEEKILKKNGYPDLGTHTKAHRQFAKNSISLRRELAEDINNLTDEVITDLRDWLIRHIEDFDSLYIPFVRMTDYIESTRQKN